MDRDKVIKGFTICSEHGLLNGEDCHGHYEYTDNLANIIKANDYSKQCPYNGCKTGCVKTLAKDALALLKEQDYRGWLMDMFHKYGRDDLIALLVPYGEENLIADVLKEQLVMCTIYQTMEKENLT